MQTKNPDLLLAEDLGKFYDDPLGFVMYAYPWDTDPTLQLVELEEPYASRFNSKYGPDVWACEILDLVGSMVRERGFNGLSAVLPILLAIASGHGIGKSTLVAWLVDWIMCTRPHAKGVVTANTAPQLESKTWAEIAKWTKKCVAGHWFKVNTGKGSMTMKHNQFPDSWRCDGQTCKEENSEAFAGLHSASSTPFYIFDEASKIPDKIWEVAEGGTTDGEPMWFAFGNPTQNSGRFKDCFGKLKHRWVTKQIDSRSVKITNKQKIQEWIDDYGMDSDFVKVRVRGMFPNMSVKQFFSLTDVDAAFGKHLRPEQYNFAPKILTLDPAWEGDDELVIGLRQGLWYRVLRTMAKNDNDITVANILAQLEDDHQADAVFIDAGYGTGIYSAGITWGRQWELVWFGGDSPDPGYLNMKAWMYGQVKQWLKAGASIPGDDHVLYQDFLNIETVPRVDGVIQVEAKKDLKKRNQPSPGRLDSCALSFARPVVKKIRGALGNNVGNHVSDYNPIG